MTEFVCTFESGENCVFEDDVNDDFDWTPRSVSHKISISSHCPLNIFGGKTKDVFPCPSACLSVFHTFASATSRKLRHQIS